MEVVTDISHFLDAPGSEELGALSRRLSRSEITRTIVVAISGPKIEDATAASARIGDALASQPGVAWVSAGPRPDVAEVVRDLYFPVRHLMLSDDPEREIPDRLGGDLRGEAAALKRALGGPFAPLVKAVAAEDPLMAFPGLLRRLRDSANPTLDVRGGQFVSRDGESAILFVGTEAPAFEVARQAPVLAAIEREFAAAQSRAAGALELEMSALARFAIRSERAIRRDVTRLSVLSALGVAALFLAIFRSLRLVAVASLPLAAALLSGTVVVLALEGRIHGMTLAFGGALVGVCIDYPIHLLSHWWCEDAATHTGDDASRALTRVWPGIRLGAATSFVGFAALAGSGFPGIREIGIFAGAGIVGSVAVTWGVVPLLVPRGRARSLARDRASRFAAALERAVASVSAHRGRAALLPIAAFALLLVSLPRLSFTDDVAVLSPVDPAIAAEEARVRARVLGPATSRVVVTLGEDEEQALRRNDAVAGVLREQLEAGRLDGFRSLHAFVWSRDLQERNWRAFSSSPALAPRLASALEAEGFRPEAFAPFEASLAAAPEPLVLADLRASPVGDWVRPFLLPREPGEPFAIATLLRGARDHEAIESALRAVDGALFFDQLALLEDGYRGLRETALRFLALGVLGVLALLALHFRSLATTAIALVPSLAAAATTAGALALLGGELNLVHLFGLLLVLAIGVDYGVFLAETVRRGEGVGATALSIALACATSVLALGMLAFSENPALRALGATTGLGVLSSLALGVALLALLAPRRTPHALDIQAPG